MLVGLTYRSLSIPKIDCQSQLGCGEYKTVYDTFCIDIMDLTNFRTLLAMRIDGQDDTSPRAWVTYMVLREAQQHVESRTGRGGSSAHNQTICDAEFSCYP